MWNNGYTHRSTIADCVLGSGRLLFEAWYQDIEQLHGCVTPFAAVITSVTPKSHMLSEDAYSFRSSSMSSFDIPTKSILSISSIIAGSSSFTTVECFFALLNRSERSW